jgi:subtilase family serine protease
LKFYCILIYIQKTNTMKKRNYFLSFLLIVSAFSNLTSQASYCASKGNAPWQEWIANVQFGTINNTSNKEGYGNFTSQTTTVAKGTSYPLSILQGFSWAPDPTNATQQGKVWIDYNQNGVFEDTELVASFTRTTVTANITIPSTALTGATRMRVSLKTIGAPTSCEVFEKGEVEDYSVNITGGTSGTPNLAITNVTGPITATPGSQITLAVTLTNTGTAPTIPTKLYYRQNGISGTPLPLTNDTASITPLAPNETRVVNYTLRLNNPIYPPNARYILSFSSPFEFGDYAVVANTRLKPNGEPDFDFGSSFKTFTYNITPIFPQANISVNVVPNKTVLQRGEKWNAVYSIKNNSTTLIKQVFFNLGTFNRLSRNFISPNFEVEIIGDAPVNSFLKRTVGEIERLGLDMFDLAPGETRSIRLDFSKILTPLDQGGGRPQDTTATGILEFPFVNTASNVVNTNTTVGATIPISVGAIASSPDLTITDVVVPSSVRINENLTFSFRFKNLGGTAVYVPNSFNPIKVSASLVSTNSNTILDIPLFKDIAAGFDTLITYNAVIRTSIATGNYTLVIEADNTNAVAESNETNNKISVPITINGAITDNSKLSITNVTGATTGEPNGTLPLSITIQNTGTLPSAPDSVFYATWRRVAFNIGYYPFNYALNRISVPAIAAGATVTVNANFILPATLRTTVVNDFKNIEPYVMLKSRERQVLSGAPLFRDSFSKISYYFPIQPSAVTDLSLSGTQLNTTWDSINPFINISLTLRNNGTTTAQNISVNVHDPRVTNNITNFNGSAVDSLMQLSGIGQLSRIFTDVNAGREENGIAYFVWKVPELAAGASVTATFRGKVIGTLGIPQNISFYYNDKTVRPYILYADVRDANKVNDSLPILNYRFVRTDTNLPDLTLSNLTVPTPSVLQGNILNFRVDAKNIGTAAATGNFTIKSYLSTDQILDASDYQNGTIPTANFAAGLIQTQVAGAMTVTNAVAAGNYYLILKIDADNTISEGNENNNTIVFTERITVTQLSGGQCFPVYDLDGFKTVGCERTNTFPTNETGRLQQYSNNIADGFILGVGVAGNTTQLYARNGTTTRPVGSRFLNCPANWIYFTAQGGVIRNDSRSTNLELNNVLVRVRTYGNATNPDSIGVEIDSSFEAGRFDINVTKLVSVSKRTVCDACWMTDRTPPSYSNCPTTEVEYPLASPTSPFFSRTLTEFFNISSTDNCGTPQSPNEYIVPNNIAANWKQAYDIKYVRFDSAGNKGVCNLRVRMSGPPCSLVTTPPFFTYCPKDTTVQVATGQTCSVVNWRIPEAIASTSLQISVRLTSNFTPSDCLPIGTTRVIYTATDSCGNTNTCSFNVTVNGGSTNTNYCAAKGTAPWEYWVGGVQINTINNTSDKFKDFATLGYSDYTSISTTLNKGQSYPLSISPGLSWIGNVPNAYTRVWIDFNQNKTFEANELVLEKTNQNPLTQNVLIPTTALTGNTRMRVALKFGAYPTACETFDRGEVEDYTINISGATVDPCLTDVAPPVFSNCPTTPIRLTINASVEPLLSINNPLVTDNCGTPTLTAVSAKSTVQIASETVSVYTAVAGSTDTITFTATDAKGNKATCKAVYITERSGGADLALSIVSTPSVFTKYSVNTIRVTAQNVGNQTLTNVKVELKRPALTSNGGSKVPSVGTFQEFCSGGIECSEWTIPTLAAGATATLDAPFFVLDANAPIVVTTKLLSSTPTDANTTNNTATVSVSPAAAGAAGSNLALSRPKASQFMPIVVQSIEPTMTDGNVTVRLESIVEKEVSFNIYNSMGKQIFSEKRKVEKGENLLNFDVSELPQGMYLIAPESSSARNTPSKFIKF